MNDAKIMLGVEHAASGRDALGTYRSLAWQYELGTTKAKRCRYILLLAKIFWPAA